MCEAEVFIHAGGPKDDGAGDASRYVDQLNSYERSGGFTANGSTTGNTGVASGGFNGDDSFESSADDDGDLDERMGGLVGLQNIANTCYMNAALQALSNTPPLTGYFLDCGDIIEANNELAISNQRKTGLAKSYYRLVKDMWLRHKRTNGELGISKRGLTQILYKL